jgi:hypothetical protein
MFIGDRVAKEKNIIRLVMMSSILGVDSELGSDNPGMEWRVEGKFMAFLFITICKRE